MAYLSVNPKPFANHFDLEAQVATSQPQANPASPQASSALKRIQALGKKGRLWLLPLIGIAGYYTGYKATTSPTQELLPQTYPLPSEQSFVFNVTQRPSLYWCTQTQAWAIRPIPIPERTCDEVITHTCWMRLEGTVRTGGKVHYLIHDEATASCWLVALGETPDDCPFRLEASPNESAWDVASSIQITSKQDGQRHQLELGCEPQPSILGIVIHIDNQGKIYIPLGQTIEHHGLYYKLQQIDLNHQTADILYGHPCPNLPWHLRFKP